MLRLLAACRNSEEEGVDATSQCTSRMPTTASTNSAAIHHRDVDGVDVDRPMMYAAGVNWRVKVLFRFPHEPLAPLWVARLRRAKYFSCNCNPPTNATCRQDTQGCQRLGVVQTSTQHSPSASRHLPTAA